MTEVNLDLADRARIVELVVAWAATVADENPIVTNVERDADLDRWYVRIRGDEKLVTTVWITVREHTLHYETYFMPAPEENIAACFEYLLRANLRFYGMRFAIGVEDAVYHVGQMPFSALAPATATEELDRVLGSAYAYSEDCFRTAMSIGYASKFRPRPPD